MSHPAIVPNTSMTKNVKPLSVVCPRFDCHYRTGHATEESALKAWEDHVSSDCPNEGSANYLMEERDEKGQRYTMVNVGKSILEKLWDELDSAFDEYNGMTDQMQLAMQQGRMRGLATGIQFMSALYYKEIDDVVREEMRRRQIRLGEIAWSPTFGYKYNPPPMGTKEYNKSNSKIAAATPKDAPSSKSRVRRQTAASKAPAVSLTPEQDSKIRKAMATGLFEAADLAASFKVSVAYINSLNEPIDSGNQ